MFESRQSLARERVRALGDQPKPGGSVTSSCVSLLWLRSKNTNRVHPAMSAGLTSLMALFLADTLSRSVLSFNPAKDVISLLSRTTRFKSCSSLISSSSAKFLPLASRTVIVRWSLPPLQTDAVRAFSVLMTAGRHGALVPNVGLRHGLRRGLRAA